MMFIDMILRSLPRSPRALVALVVLWVGGGWMLTGLQDLLLPDEAGYTGGGLQFFGGLVITIAATITFFYFQHQDGEGGKGYSHLETINKYHEAEQRETRIKGAEVTPVFSSHHGEHPPEQPTRKPD
jgi:hypothetical protein